VKAVADVLGVARSNLVEQIKDCPRQRLGRPPAPADALVAEIKAVIADLPTYGYRRVHALLRRRALAEGRQPPNHKRAQDDALAEPTKQRHGRGVRANHQARLRPGLARPERRIHPASASGLAGARQ
jgi:putative transposase